MIKVGVLGATSPAGKQALRMLAELNVLVVAFSRESQQDQLGIQWINLSEKNVLQQLNKQEITHWIALSHIWVLAEYFDVLKQLKAKKIVCISSTSRFTKIKSASNYENELVVRLKEGEAALQKWAEQHEIQWTVLRPTLIYGRGNDRNISEIVKFIRKFRVFPLLGEAKGLRQPIYVDDVAKAAVQALFSTETAGKSYNISGAERLTYREMVKRVFMALGRKPFIFSIPLWAFRLVLNALHFIPRYRGWNDQMVLRMNQDMVFKHDDAERDFGFKPQVFILKDRDVP